MLSSSLVKRSPVATSQIFATGLYDPINITGDSNGNLYVIDFFGDTIKVNQQGVKSAFVGNSANRGFADGTGAAAIFNRPTALTADAAGNIYIADNGNARVRIATPDAAVTTISNFYQIGVREMGVSPDGSKLYMRSSNSGDTTTTPNISYFANNTNYGSITLTGLAFPQDVYARTVTYNQNGFAYFSQSNQAGTGPKLYRIDTPTITSNVTSLGANYTPVTVDVNGYPGSNTGTTYTQYSNIFFPAGTIVTVGNFAGGQYRNINGRIFTVGFSNVSSDTYPLGGTFIDIVSQLFPAGMVDNMPVTVTRTGTGASINTTLISNEWTSGSYFASGGTMYLYFSNDLSSLGLVSTQVSMSGLTGLYAAYNGVQYTMTDGESEEAPFRYEITVTPPAGSIGSAGTLTSFTATAGVTGVTGVPATLSNLFSPSANVLTAMSSGYLKKYTLVGDVATEAYSCNVSLYNGIGGVPNLLSTIIPEVYTLIPGAPSGPNGSITVIRNVY